MELDPKLIKQLLKTFRLELEEQGQIITDGLIELENKELNPDTRQQTLDAVFRAAHNIKGAARGVEINTISEIAHHLESLLSGLRQSSQVPSQKQIDLSLEAVDRMRDAMNAQVKGTALTFDLEDLNNRLNEHALQVAGESDAEPVATKPSAAPAEQAATRMPDVNPVAPAAHTPASATPSGEEATMGSDSIRVSADKLDNIGALAEELLIAKIQMDDHFATVSALRDRVDQFSRLWTQSFRQMKRNDIDTLPAWVRQLSMSSVDMLSELNNTVKQTHKHMRNTANSLGFISTSLQGDVHLLRMVPVSTVVRPMLRTVRDISRELGKTVNLDISGDDLEIDRMVLQGMRDPLIHLLRNAIDHGIEEAAERTKAGKSPEGRIAIRVRTEGSQAVIEVSDDGSGIDIKQVTQAAIKKRAIDATEADGMSRQDLLELIFRPGFSTKAIITGVSGRGVGLDVVQTNLRSLKGSIAIDTQPGKGTTFSLRLPLTLSAEHGLIVRSGGRLFAIPVTSIERVMKIRPDQIRDVEASQAVIINEQPIPLRDLAAVLEMEVRESLATDMIPVVVVSKGRHSVALVVEEIVGEREIVIKPLRPPLISVRNVAGATMTGTGEVFVVLNAMDLVDSALRAGKHRRSSRTKDAKAEIKQQRILVVDDSITTRTLERNILEAKGYDVTIAIDGKEAWDTMQTSEFDLIVTDIEMPVMNGFDLTERIKQSEKFHDIPVVIVTSRATDADKQRGIDVGADAYIVKSQFETKALLDVVRQLV